MPSRFVYRAVKLTHRDMCDIMHRIRIIEAYLLKKREVNTSVVFMKDETFVLREVQGLRMLYH